MPYREYWHHESWDEFHDDEIVDWKRLRLCIEHENALVNHRLTWLFASQAFLFTSFGVIWNAWKNPSGNNIIPTLTCQAFLMAISCIGIIVCRAIQQSLIGAEAQIIYLDRWWYYRGNVRPGEKYKNIQERQYVRAQRDSTHPPLQGDIHIEGNYLGRVLSFTHLPNWFTAMWFFLVISIVFEGSFIFLARSLTDLSYWMLFASLLLLSSGICVLFRKTRPAIERAHLQTLTFSSRLNYWSSRNSGLIIFVIIFASIMSSFLGVFGEWHLRLLFGLSYSVVLAYVVRFLSVTLDTEPMDAIVKVVIEDNKLIMHQRCGRSIRRHLSRYQKLNNASDQDRGNVSIEGGGYVLHWKALDEYLSTAEILADPNIPENGNH